MEVGFPSCSTPPPPPLLIEGRGRIRKVVSLKIEGGERGRPFADLRWREEKEGVRTWGRRRLERVSGGAAAPSPFSFLTKGLQNPKRKKKKFCKGALLLFEFFLQRGDSRGF
jgi:hypothetical protein